MGIFFRKGKNIEPCVNLNVSNSSASVSLGVKGLHVSANTNGTKSMSASIHRTGLSARKTFSKNTSAPDANNNQINFSSDNLGNSGNNSKKPWYKKTWVIVLLSFFCFMVIVSALGNDDDSSNDTLKFTTLQEADTSTLVECKTTSADKVPVYVEIDTTFPTSDTTPTPATTTAPTTTPAPTTTLAPATTSVPTTTTTPTTTVKQAEATIPTPEPQQNLVWISKTGKKYHRNSSCSNMKNPSQVTLDKAQSLGLEPCKKCY